MATAFAAVQQFSIATQDDEGITAMTWCLDGEGNQNQPEEFLAGSAVLTVVSSARHPKLGSGALCILALPSRLEEAVLDHFDLAHDRAGRARAALALNGIESAMARTHFLGSWSLHASNEDAGPVFVCFVPSYPSIESVLSMTLSKICLSMLVKARWLAQYCGIRG